MTAEEWQKRGLELTREGLEITVVGRAKRLSGNGSGTGAEAPPPPAQSAVAGKKNPLIVTFTVRLTLAALKFAGLKVSSGAVSRMSRLLENLLKGAAGHAHQAKRDQVTEQDVDEAWSDLRGVKRGS
jgi:histone H3/H4